MTQVLSTNIKEEVEQLIKKINDGQWNLGKHFVQLGNKLLEIRTKRHWSEWGFESFGKYIETIREQIDKGRTQLYQTISISEKLLPTVSEADLEQMGISKAGELKKVVQAGKQPTPELIEKAKDRKVGVQELRAEVLKETSGEVPKDNETYWDLGGFFVTKEERDEIKKAFHLAEIVDPPISKELPDHIRRKETMFRLCREFTGTYEELESRV